MRLRARGCKRVDIAVRAVRREAEPRPWSLRALRLLLVIGGAGAPAFAQPVPATADADTAAALAAEMRAAAALRGRVVYAPSANAPLDLSVPEAAARLGHSGVVRVRGLVDATGRFTPAGIASSSGSALLDARALELARALPFRAARDAQRAPLAAVASLELGFTQLNNGRSGELNYRCASYLAETDWWQARHPDARLREHPAAQALGFAIVSRRLPPGVEYIRDGEYTQAIDDRLAFARDACRAQPDAFVVDVLGVREFVKSPSRYWERERRRAARARGRVPDA